MGGIGSAFQFLNCLRSFAFGTWSTLLECRRRSPGADSLKGRKELMRKGAINFFDGDQLAENSLTAITLESLITVAIVPPLDG